MNLFELFVKIGADTSEFERASDDIGKKTSTLGEKIQKGLSTAAKVGMAAVTAAAAGVTALTKASLDGYANYEQLVGGVETLFKSSQDIVLKYADNAYKTAGLSANQYMETVTSFSASLLQSLDGDTTAAAEKANVAITDMADNANKMGTSMESIQNAYQGFAKQNYTMLDNLKLGYGGTKEEMQRLLDDANALNAAQGNYTNYTIESYADIVDAIHTVQAEMGITGTTAKEAATTIQGSVASAKSAWANLVTGIADENANLSGLIGTFVESVATAASNIVPRVTQILSGIGEAITQIAPVISEQIPKMLSDALPPLLDAAISLVAGTANGVIAVLPDILNTALDALPQLIDAAGTIITNLFNALVEAAPMIVDAGVDILDQLTDGLIDGIPNLIARIPEIIEKFLNYITTRLPDILKKGGEISMKLQDGIIQAIPQLVAALPQIITSIVNFVTQNLPLIVETGVKMLVNMITGIIKAIPQLVESLPQIIDAICSGIENLLPSIIDIGAEIVKGLWEGIKSLGSWIKEKVSGFFSGIVDSVKGLLGIHSPSRVFAGIGGNMALGLGEGFDDEFSSVRKRIESGLDFSGISPGISITAKAYQSGAGAGAALRGVNVIQNIYAQKMTPSQTLQEAIYLQKRAVMLGV
nr:MAG TPA: tail tape measure protein [Caudoviricetes sp.]